MKDTNFKTMYKNKQCWYIKKYVDIYKKTFKYAKMYWVCRKSEVKTSTKLYFYFIFVLFLFYFYFITEFNDVSEPQWMDGLVFLHPKKFSYFFLYFGYFRYSRLHWMTRENNLRPWWRPILGSSQRRRMIFFSTVWTDRPTLW